MHQHGDSDTRALLSRSFPCSFCVSIRNLRLNFCYCCSTLVLSLSDVVSWVGDSNLAIDKFSFAIHLTVHTPRAMHLVFANLYILVLGLQPCQPTSSIFQATYQLGAHSSPHLKLTWAPLSPVYFVLPSTMRVWAHYHPDHHLSAKRAGKAPSPYISNFSRNAVSPLGTPESTRTPPPAQNYRPVLPPAVCGADSYIRWHSNVATVSILPGPMPPLRS